MQHINGQVSKRELTRLTSWFQPLLLTPILNKADTLKLCETLWETMVPHPYCNKNVKIVTPKWVSSECRFPAYFRWEWNYEEENLEVKAINTLLSACLYLITELMIFLFVSSFSYRPNCDAAVSFTIESLNVKRLEDHLSSVHPPKD